MQNLTVLELIKSTNGNLIIGNNNESVNDIVIDSRKANSQNAFVAIIGENLDGHKFMQAAYENGCKTFIKNKSSIINIEHDDINLIEVENTEIAFGQIAKYYKKKFDIPYIGITGSVGKTTTRDMVYAAVSSRLDALKNEGNLNNHFGVPLTLFNLQDSHECAVIEMGMSHFKEIEYLANIVKPNIAVISNIGLSHVENLGSQEGILQAKMEITTNFTKSDVLIVNGDDKFLKTLKEKNLHYKLKTFGFGKDNSIYCEGYEMFEDSTVFSCTTEGETYSITIPTVGEHNIYNAMAAILVGRTLNIPIQDIKRGLENYKATKMRWDVIKKENMTIINDAYNASPDSMKAALKILKRYENRRVAILGDMFEMGEHEEYGHRLVGKDAVDNCDVLITIGESSRFISDEAKKLGFDESNIHHFATKEETIKYLNDLIKNQDVVLVKASRGMQLEKIVEYLNN